VARYLLVGFIIPSLQPSHLKRHPSQKKQRPVGVNLDPTSVIDTPDSPILVVAQIHETNEPKHGVALYALLNRPGGGGLCVPHIVGQRECFYLPRFRDATTDLKKRGPAWNVLVREVCFRPSPVGPSGPEPEMDGEPVAELSSSYQALEDFLDNAVNNWNDENSRHMIAEFYERWPGTRDVSRLTISEISFVKDQLLTEDLFVEDRLLRPFVLTCHTMILEEIRKATSRGLEADMSNICATALKLLVVGGFGASELTAADSTGMEQG
jgi:hypothetical protein